MLTMGLRRELLDEHAAFVNCHIRGKRDRSALKLNSVGASDAWAKGRCMNGAISRIHFKPREMVFTLMKVAGRPKRRTGLGDYEVDDWSVQRRRQVRGSRQLENFERGIRHGLEALRV